MTAKEVRARQRELARAEQSLFAAEALAEKARLEEERRRKKEEDTRRKERERKEKKEAERLAKEQRELHRQEARRLEQQEEMRRAAEYIAARKDAAAEAQERRAAAQRPAAATQGQPRRADVAADAPTHRAPATSLPPSATTDDGLTCSSQHVLRLLNAAALATVAAFPTDDFFSAALCPLMWCPSSPPGMRRPDGDKLLAFASKCALVLHEAWRTGKAYPPSKAEVACAAFAGAYCLLWSICTYMPTHAHTHTCTCTHAQPYLCAHRPTSCPIAIIKYTLPYPAGEANGSEKRALLAEAYEETLMPGGAHKLGLVFFRFWKIVVDLFVHANAEVVLHLPA